jgi:alpha-glucosidase
MSWCPVGKLLVCTTLAIVVNYDASAQSAPVVLASPDQRVVLQFTTIAAKEASGSGGKLSYSVSFRGKQVIDASALGLELEGQPTLGNDVEIVDSTRGQGSDEYTLLAGKTREVKDSYNSLLLRTVESNGSKRALVIEARAYDDGVAFRYILPEQDAIKSLTLKQEDTEFRISTDATTWALALPNYRSS